MEKMTPLQRYRDDISRGGLIADPVQQEAVMATQLLYDELLASATGRSGLMKRLLRRLKPEPETVVTGLYFWGGVGRGKTRIIDNFFECLPMRKKLRIHFHRFMQRVHNELKSLDNISDPLQVVADRFARQARVICFDEFHVSDITDAMLLGGLLGALFDRGIILVATSNEHPDKLYRNGLQRSQFLPAIELIKEHTRIINVDSGIDYRLRYLDSAEIYHHPLDARADEMLSENFINIAPNPGRSQRTIEIEKRKIRTEQCADGVVWFDFSAICRGPRGPADYIEIARQFQTVLVANVPCMGRDMNDEARRFINMVDEFYDRNVKLFMTAEVAIEDLYQGQRLEFEFRRTASRLVEMQSHEYLARQHLTD